MIDCVLQVDDRTREEIKYRPVGQETYIPNVYKMEASLDLKVYELLNQNDLQLLHWIVRRWATNFGVTVNAQCTYRNIEDNRVDCLIRFDGVRTSTGPFDLGKRSI